MASEWTITERIRAWSPGSFVSDSQMVDSEADIPPYCYMWERVTVKTTTDPDGKPFSRAEVVKGSRKIIGQAYSLAEVKALEETEGNYRTLILNMEGNKWPRVVRCRQGFLPLNEDDTVVDVHPGRKESPHAG